MHTPNFNLFESNVNLEQAFGFSEAEKSISNYSNTIKTTNDSNSSSPNPYEFVRNEISKKTNRGRKENFSLPKNISQCEICLKYSDQSKEELINCSICKCLFHESCYKQYETISPSLANEKPIYTCQRCVQAKKLNKPINDKIFNCFICGNSNKVLKYNPLNRNFYHSICLCFIPELHNLPGEELTRDNIRKWRYKNSCKYCGAKLSKSVAVIKCKRPKCKDYYHIPCSIEKGMIFDLNFMKQFYDVFSNDQIPFFCSNHNKKISNNYKNFIMKKINDDNVKIKEEKKTFSNNFVPIEDKKMENEDIFEEKKQDENEEEKIFGDINRSFSSMFTENEIFFRNDNNNENEEIEKEEEQEQEEEKQEEEEEKTDIMDLDESYDKNNAFYLNFPKRLNETNCEDNNENNSTVIFSENNNKTKNFNVDEFCLNKKSGFILNRRDSYNFWLLNT